MTALQSLDAVGAADSRSLLSQLAGLFGRQTVDWLEVDFLPGAWRPRKSLIPNAKGRHSRPQRLAFTYFGASGEKTQRVAEPAKLCYKSSAWYLQAFCLARGEWRTFKLCRMLRPHAGTGLRARRARRAAAA